MVLRNLLSLPMVATGELLTQRFAFSVLPACFALGNHGRLSHGWFVMLSLPYGRDSITTASAVRRFHSGLFLTGRGRLSHGWFVMLSLPYGRDSITTASQLTVLGNMSTPTHFSILYPAASITFRSRTNDVGLQDIYTILLAPNSSIFGNAFG